MEAGLLMVFQNFEDGITDQAESSMRLFADKVLPELQSWPTH